MRGLKNTGNSRKIQNSISFSTCIKDTRESISLCLIPVGKRFYEQLRVKSKDFCSSQFWWHHWNTVCNMTSQIKTLILSRGQKGIWIIRSSQTVKYYCEMNIYYLIVKFTTSMTVNSMFKCQEFNLAKVNEVIF